MLTSALVVDGVSSFFSYKAGFKSIAIANDRNGRIRLARLNSSVLKGKIID